MKKIYLKPEMTIVEMNVNQQILAGSVPGLDGGDFGSGDPVLSPEVGDREDQIFGSELDKFL
jgi:hypothetical protein